jgi:hypothetical protein
MSIPTYKYALLAEATSKLGKNILLDLLAGDNFNMSVCPVLIQQQLFHRMLTLLKLTIQTTLL